MREIKYRTAHYNLNGEFECFTYWGPCYESDGSISGFKSPSFVRGTTNAQHEQYIGVKDKNGVEIYEGDLYKRQNYLYKVIWSDYEDGFRGVCIARQLDNSEGYEMLIKPSKKHYYVSSDDADDVSEVIGNIHQNQELLKQGI